MIPKFGTQKKSAGRFVTVKLRTRLSAPDRRRLLMGKGPPRWLKRLPSEDVTDYQNRYHGLAAGFSGSAERVT